MRFVDQQRELLVAEVAEFVEDERELLYGRDDDLLASTQEIAQFHMIVGLDRIRNLRVQHAAVGDDDDGIELRLTRVCDRLEFDQLVRKPRNRVALAAARRVLDQVTLAHAVTAAAAQ
jgi:hypothetical protein